MRRLGWLAYLFVDVIGVLLFCAVGRRSHDEGLNIGGVATTAWPFLAGTVVPWLAATHRGGPHGGDRLAVHRFDRHAVAPGQFGGGGGEFRGGGGVGHRDPVARVAGGRRAGPAAALRRLRRRWHGRTTTAGIRPAASE